MTSNDPDTDPQSDSDLGDNGKKAIQAERSRANAAERQLAQVQAQLESANRRITEFESTAEQYGNDLASRDLQITRLRVGLDKGLTGPLIDRLQGTDQESFEADADALLALFPPAVPAAGGAPKPDPSQGSRIPAATTPRDSFKAAMGEVMNL